VVLPTSNGSILKIRQATNPEPVHREIYATLGIPAELIKPLRTRHETVTENEKPQQDQWPV
jgi:hypothetical protein